ncbi:MAG: hypothetical protein AB7N71_14820, partial [Phycisphaerae bacterium]
FLQIKMVVDDRVGKDVVALFINEQYIDTKAYQTVTLPEDFRGAVIGGDAGAEFSDVNIRILP